LGACLATLEQQNAVDKDFHLLVAAMASDKTILSQDNKLREILHAAAGDVSVLRRLVFANPAVADEAVTDWLNRGAPAERERCLGHRR
jgi:hypothetical protein